MQGLRSITRAISMVGIQCMPQNRKLSSFWISEKTPKTWFLRFSRRRETKRKVAPGRLGLKSCSQYYSVYINPMGHIQTIQCLYTLLRNTAKWQVAYEKRSKIRFSYSRTWRWEGFLAHSYTSYVHLWVLPTSQVSAPMSHTWVLSIPKCDFSTLWFLSLRSRKKCLPCGSLWGFKGP